MSRAAVGQPAQVGSPRDCRLRSLPVLPRVPSRHHHGLVPSAATSRHQGQDGRGHGSPCDPTPLLLPLSLHPVGLVGLAAFWGPGLCFPGDALQKQGRENAGRGPERGRHGLAATRRGPGGRPRVSRALDGLRTPAAAVRARGGALLLGLFVMGFVVAFLGRDEPAARGALRKARVAASTKDGARGVSAAHAPQANAASTANAPADPLLLPGRPFLASGGSGLNKGNFIVPGRRCGRRCR